MINKQPNNKDACFNNVAPDPGSFADSEDLPGPVNAGR